MDYMTWQDFVYVSLQIIAIVIAILSYLHRNDDSHHDDSHHDDGHHDDSKKR